ncbi:hypothetical protein RclHR1_05710002 [Rhizophagus clarus]|uniref:Uncharacterized protein n=1 Tax=Rhizophagus clarus TaxID=94130 RepID=A0A2Z6SGQ1_9GLOM|nr:hypothetical protein RclHR1_05710002 [Rhizophagus clarus]GES76074.1 hypothetical protein RCL_jg20368.t1 [Rhizophagus clarus]
MFSSHSRRLLTKHFANAQTKHFISQDNVKSVIEKSREMKEYIPIAALAFGIVGSSVFAMKHSINSAVKPLLKKLDRIDDKVNDLGNQLSYVMGYLKIPIKVEQNPIKKEGMKPNTA